MLDREGDIAGFRGRKRLVHGSSGPDSSFERPRKPVSYDD